MYTINDLYDLDHTQAKEYLSKFTYPWEALKGIKDMIVEIGSQLPKDEYDEVKEHVWVHKTAHVFASAYLGAPCIIGAKDRKNVILFDHVQTPHYNYVGDSILGYYAHTGAGAITSNVKSDKNLVVVHDRIHHEEIETGLKKFGAMLGDHVEVGCNSVLNPGTVIGRNSRVYPTSCVRGVVPENSIWKNDGTIKMQENAC